VLGSGGPVPAIFRTYARGAYGTPNIVEEIGATGPGLARAIVAMQEENGRTCPDTKDNESTTRTLSALSLPPMGDAVAGTLRTGGSELGIAEIWVASPVMPYLLPGNCCACGAFPTAGATRRAADFSKSAARVTLAARRQDHA
jgi:hypothetical protein